MTLAKTWSTNFSHPSNSQKIGCLELLGVNSVSGSSEVKLGDSVLVVDDNNLVGVGKLSLKASASTTTFFNRGLVSKYRLDS